MSLSLCPRWRNKFYLFIYLFIYNDQQSTKMFVQNLNRIVRKPNFMQGQILYCTAQSIPIALKFQQNFPTNT